MNLERYKRQIAIRTLGVEGQEKLRQSRVAIIGAGGLGSVISEQLCRSGVGYLKITDRDIVEITNLHRQILYDEEDARRKRPKAVTAAEHLSKMNSEVHIEPLDISVDASCIDDIIGDVHLVLDATDNFETRMLIGEACQKHRIPWIYGAVLGTSGAVMNVFPDGSTRPDGSPFPTGGPCLRCLFGGLPEKGSYPTCDTEGVLPMIVSVVGSIQASEAIKILSGNPKLNTMYLSIDLWEESFDYIEIQKAENCPLCVQNKYELLL